MVQLSENPATRVCPDFTIDEHAEDLSEFISEGITDAAAAALLARAWKANQRTEAEEWRKANEEAAVAEEERLQAFAEDNASRLAQDALDQEEAFPINMRDPPNQRPDIPCVYALKRLKEGVYLELYYLGCEGLDAAKTTAGQALDEGLQPVIDPVTGGSTWIAASAKRDTNSFKRDEDLTWDEFAGAVPRMLLTMQNARWPAEHITMMVKFWGNILSHSLRLSTDPIDERTLLL
ncbi:hypothetical protein M422DRAFT_262612 [Sphaerobolus stellatus SS14]|uniref:Uncharacterized protein n=1 Tax=Sphaerobolus stellatus (strain SS14) TaxID=990650 RepID=A0A0C9VCW9_SPHS4|nr:hypothetical protein M422DRAFT_262612 [Sphaerobolus stellatus SS14]